MPESVKNLLPTLKDESKTEVIIVTLPEATPVYEATRLQDDLHRAEIPVKWWIVNQSMYATKTSNELLSLKVQNEVPWINKVSELTSGNYAIVKWNNKELSFKNLRNIID